MKLNSNPNLSLKYIFFFYIKYYFKLKRLGKNLYENYFFASGFYFFQEKKDNEKYRRLVLFRFKKNWFTMKCTLPKFQVNTGVNIIQKLYNK